MTNCLQPQSSVNLVFISLDLQPQIIFTWIHKQLANQVHTYYSLYRLTWQLFHLPLNEMAEHWGPWSRKHRIFNALQIKLFSKNVNSYSKFLSLPHTDMTQVVEILCHVRKGLTYSTTSISWVLMSWRRLEPGHQQPWYWPSSTKISRSRTLKVNITLN